MTHSPTLLASAGALALVSLLSGCAQVATVQPAAMPAGTPVDSLNRNSVLEAAMVARRETVAPFVAAASAPAQQPAPPRAEPPPGEPRFDLIVNNAPARELFLALAADGRFNLLLHPDVGGQVSMTLKRVTLREALDALREVHGYDYKVDGRRIVVYPPTMQSRVFVVNYLHSQRSGRSDLRVSSGTAPANTGAAGGGAGSTVSPSGNGQPDSSQVSTQSHNDLWAELGDSVRSMIGTANGRSVIVSPQAGLLAVRAMPDELRQVEAMLGAARLAIERQVMLDVKIVQVELREGYQSGIDWSALRSRGSVGQLSGNANNPLLTNPNGLPVLNAGTAALADALSAPVGAGGLFGLSLATNGFQAVMGFLETHGEVQTLSSPRLATLNNQKAVLKVGVDDYFVTNVSGGTVANTSSGSNGTTTTMPTLTLTPFFSGIALDVTPQIDDGHMITLHVHPSVSAVSERNKQVDLGTLGAYKLPLASSSINETDTVVRIPDGQIVAIGGLMQMETSRQTSGLPGSSSNAITANLLGNRGNSGKKKELVVLIKPTIIRSADDWQDQTQAAWSTLSGTDAPASRVIRMDGTATTTASAPPAAPSDAAAPPSNSPITSTTVRPRKSTGPL